MCNKRVWHGMGQLAGSRKTPLAMTFFGESLIKTITTLEIWRTQVKLAILAQEGINLDVLFNQKPTTVTLPPESHYEQPIDNPTEVTKWETKIRKRAAKILVVVEVQEKKQTQE